MSIPLSILCSILALAWCGETISDRIREDPYIAMNESRPDGNFVTPNCARTVFGHGAPAFAALRAGEFERF